jgi:hypothetical protein
MFISGSFLNGVDLVGDGPVCPAVRGARGVGREGVDEA